MSKKHRLFFALVPDQPILDRIAAVQHAVNGNGRAARPHQFHVTLAFLGMQETAQVPAILEVASRLEFTPCNVALDRLGRFKRAGVLWLGSKKIPGSLQTFQQALVDGLLAAGIGYDRKPWIFHLTLYRKMRKRPPIMDPVAIEWPINGFQLIESVGVKNGVEYHTIGQWSTPA